MNFIKNVLVLSLFLFPIFCLATEGRVGNGGNSVICENTHDMRFQNKTMLLDFAEFDLLYAPNSISESDEEVMIQAQKALARVRTINRQTADDLEAVLIAMRESRRRVKKNLTEWFQTQDTGSLNLPAPHGVCRIFPTIIFSDRHLAFIVDENRLQSLSRTHQAGLWIHEALYFLARRHSSAVHSKSIRLITGLLFSRDENPGMLRALLYLFVDRKPWTPVFHLETEIGRLRFSKPTQELFSPFWWETN